MRFSRNFQKGCYFLSKYEPKILVTVAAETVTKLEIELNLQLLRITLNNLRELGWTSNASRALKL